MLKLHALNLSVRYHLLNLATYLKKISTLVFWGARVGVLLSDINFSLFYIICMIFLFVIIIVYCIYMMYMFVNMK